MKSHVSEKNIFLMPVWLRNLPRNYFTKKKPHFTSLLRERQGHFLTNKPSKMFFSQTAQILLFTEKWQDKLKRLFQHWKAKSEMLIIFSGISISRTRENRSPHEPGSIPATCCEPCNHVHLYRSGFCQFLLPFSLQMLLLPPWTDGAVDGELFYSFLTQDLKARKQLQNCSSGRVRTLKVRKGYLGVKRREGAGAV